jgi:uncharacterized membrane protein YedE/YeeE
MPLDWINGLLGGLLLGGASAAYLLVLGRIAGISGIAGGLLDDGSPAGDKWRNALFLIGIVIGAKAMQIVAGQAPLAFDRSLPLLVAGGLIVGFGSRLGSGCTSGHGVCGMARFSMRSVVATMIFMAAAIATVAIRHGV